MRNLLFTTILVFFSGLTFAQTTAAANKSGNNNMKVWGQITYAAPFGTGAGGYVTPATADLKAPAPQLQMNPGITYTVYPNPAGAAVSIKIQSQNVFSYLKIELYDLNGKKVAIPYKQDASGKYAFARINLNGLPKGTYLVKIQIDKTEKTFKLIKNQ